VFFPLLLRSFVSSVPPLLHTFGSWFLAFGFWLLAFGFWLLAFGFWGSVIAPISSIHSSSLPFFFLIFDFYLVLLFVVAPQAPSFELVSVSWWLVQPTNRTSSKK
jgi:hypothetical protein